MLLKWKKYETLSTHKDEDIMYFSRENTIKKKQEYGGGTVTQSSVCPLTFRQGNLFEWLSNTHIGTFEIL